ncbi:hypothetical protein FZC84_11925 [Rossellomorea vietnamensis]|uniref:Uncharacterized protein n=1 Tax=Rossellomorea vietnamensis TaxID=218284 RepID=A0A5D4MC61_9BACI|nr:hypothetical protein [Rossellomorea vietnamensis]TYR99078.1 hypothetical protein FZC84_11925 [Rossellomorea vietnamensis]
MPYKVIRAFRDKEDDGRTYSRNDIFPAHGEVSIERFNELSGPENDAGYPLIKEIGAVQKPSEDPKDEGGQGVEFPKHTGGGWYELSNGERVQGKEDALAAEAELKN